MAKKRRGKLSRRMREARAILDKGMYVIPSPDDVLAAATGGCGWSAKTLATWGVPWPPPAGWRNELQKRWLASRIFASMETDGQI